MLLLISSTDGVAKQTEIMGGNLDWLLTIAICYNLDKFLCDLFINVC